MSADLKAMLEMFSKLSAEDKAAIAGVVAPVTAIKPVAPVCEAKSAQNANGFTSSVRIKVAKRIDAYLHPETILGVLSYADQVALAASEAVKGFDPKKMPEGLQSWENTLLELAETLSGPCSAWRAKFEPAKAETAKK